MPIRVIRPGDGEPVLSGSIGLRIIEDGSPTGHRLGLVESTLQPGPARPPQHVHHEHDEVFLLTACKLRFTSGTESVDVDAGSVVVIPIGVPHTFSNPFQGTAVFIGTMTPDPYIQYFRDIGQLPVGHAGVPDTRDIARTMTRYATEVVQTAERLNEGAS